MYNAGLIILKTKIINQFCIEKKNLNETIL